MSINERIEQYFNGKDKEFTDALARLIAVPSERGEATDKAPYGVEPLRALEQGLEIAAEWGLKTKNWENTVGCVDLLPDNDDRLHILAHLDVVPAGEGWTRPPFEMTADDAGNLYGRGVADDKGPALSALIAMRAVKDLGVELKHNCRLILGTDEELGSSDIAKYYAANPYGVNSFTPDSQFPAIITEKGHYNPVITASWQSGDGLPLVTCIRGGEKKNVIPARAYAEVVGFNESAMFDACQIIGERCNVTFSMERIPSKDWEPKGLAITCEGTGGHAAYPQGGANNALTALLKLLAYLPLDKKEPANQAVFALANMFPHGDWLGKALGVAQSDEISGELTLTFSVCDLTKDGLRAQFDARVPICANEANCAAVCETACAAHGFTAEGDMGPAHHVPADSEFVQILLRNLEEITGITGEPLAIGGGTYVHNIPGGVAFGCTFPDTETYIHGADETIPLHELMASAKVFTKVIIDLCGA